MHYRSKEHIYRPSQLAHVDEQQMRRTCSQWIWNAIASNCLEMLTSQINNIVDPYDREYYVTLTHELLLEYMSPDCFTPIQINANAWEELQDDFRRINRHASHDQCEEEYAGSTDNRTTTAYHSSDEDPHIQALERNMAYLQQEINEIKLLITQQATADSAYIWPTYTAHATEDDKRTFEDFLQRLCRSTKKSMTKDIKNYLKAKKDAGIILRSEQISTEYEWVKRFGYPRTEKTYYNG